MRTSAKMEMQNQGRYKEETLLKYKVSLSRELRTWSSVKCLRHALVRRCLLMVIVISTPYNFFLVLPKKKEKKTFSTKPFPD